MAAVYPAGPEPMMTTLAWVVFGIVGSLGGGFGRGLIALHNLGISSTYARYATRRSTIGRALRGEILLRAGAEPAMPVLASFFRNPRFARRFGMKVYYLIGASTCTSASTPSTARSWP